MELPHDWSEYINLESIKVDHLRLDEDDDQEDNYISVLCQAALTHVSNSIARELFPSPDDFDTEEKPDATSLTPPLRHAAYLLIAHWYENRESVTIGVNAMKTPHAFEMLVFPYINNGFMSFHGGD